ncbi:MAG: hypothetical protein A2694_00790 [Candidatus Blackburnbacteria bacterium RIFCSPHIGHO2_01_FULL_40_17]|nr:MAG: hypothetical protein A2694_00790 [Candidatus Blackburnbacteria bacterium RIFCSPHIGHO2_01_FULL_40_17]
MNKLLKAFSGTKALLALIFLAGLLVRFLYFPDNIYFGFDQARDAYESQSIYKNFDIKLVGPPTSSPDFFHGPLYWYLVGPIYILGGGDPSVPAGFMRIYNALGIFIIFCIAKMLFNSRVGLVASVLYAFSFEQTQYAIYFHHPPLAVLTIMLFYGGLAAAIFKKNWWGVPISLLGYGLSVQSEFQLLYLGVIFILLCLIFRRRLLPLVNTKTLLISALFFLVSVSTFILAEFQFGGRTIQGMWAMVFQKEKGGGDWFFAFNTYLKRLVLQIHDNILGVDGFAPILLFLLLFVALIYILTKRKESSKILFLAIWFLSTSVLTFFGPISLYYTNVGISPALLLIVSFFVAKIYEKLRWFAVAIVVLIAISNINLIKEQNYKGVIGDIQVQEGMLLGREKQALDYIYNESEGKPIVVSASTMPLRINTTWAYLFNWYGNLKYGRVPYWAGPTAQGYPGELPRWTSQEQSYVAFGIIEPVRGVRGAFIEQFKEEQKQYGEYVGEFRLGDEKSQSQIIVQKSIHSD